MYREICKLKKMMFIENLILYMLWSGSNFDND